MTEQITLLGNTVKNDRKAKRLINQLVVELQRPTILHSMWSDIIPESQLHQVKIKRLKRLMINKGKKISAVTDFEAMLWISTESMLSPLCYEGYNIYVYLFKKYFPEQAKEIFSKYELERQLDLSEQQELKNLKQRLYTLSVRSLKERKKQ